MPDDTGEARFLEKLLDSQKLRESASYEVNRIADLQASGYLPKSIRIASQYRNYSDLMFELSRARVSVEKKFSRSKEMWLDSYSASYSTPEIIGNYRASRVGNREILDLGAGACMQSIMFSLVSDEVTAIERDRKRVALGKLNAISYESNLSVIRDDALNYCAKVQDSVLFSDPVRLAGRSEKTLETLDPRPDELLRAAPKSNDFIFDLPPLMPLQNLPFEGEREYISINGRLSRLTYYSKDIMKAERSAVQLPSGRRIEGTADSTEYETSVHPGAFFILPDPSIVYSNLLNEVFDPSMYTCYFRDNRRIVLTSDKIDSLQENGEYYEILKETDASSLSDELARLRPSRVIPRYNLDPVRYYRFVASITNKDWSGERVYLFRNGDRIFIARKLRNEGS